MKAIRVLILAALAHSSGQWEYRPVLAECLRMLRSGMPFTLQYPRPASYDHCSCKAAIPIPILSMHHPERNIKYKAYELDPSVPVPRSTEWWKKRNLCESHVPGDASSEVACSGSTSDADENSSPVVASSAEHSNVNQQAGAFYYDGDFSGSLRDLPTDGPDVFYSDGDMSISSGGEGSESVCLQQSREEVPLYVIPPSSEMYSSAITRADHLLSACALASRFNLSAKATKAILEFVQIHIPDDNIGETSAENLKEDPLVADLIKLYQHGTVFTHKEDTVCSRAMLVVVTMDLQARAYVLNMTQHNGLTGCLYCTDPGVVVQSGKGRCRAYPFNPSCQLRTETSARESATAARRSGQRTSTTALEKYFIPKRNKEYDVYQFRKAKQKVGENVTTYNTRLRKLAEYCEFADIEAEIKSQIVQSCSSARLRRRALRDGDMTLENLLTLARAFELSDQQAQDIEGSKPEEVNFMKNKSRGRGKTRGKGREKNPEGPATSNSQKTYKPQAQQNKTCYRCGGTFPHKSKPCPAKGQKCTVCSKIGHFGKMCRSKDYKARAVTGDDTSSDDDGYTFMATTKSRKSQPNTAVSINGNMVDIIVDTGATINILDQQSYKKITPRPKVMTTKTKIFPYGNGDSIDIQGTFEATFEWHGQETTGKIFVVKGQFGSLLSYTTAVELGIIPVIRVVEPNLSEPDILEQYSDRFEGIGCIKGVQAKIHIDESVQPVAQQHRRIPFHMRKKVEAEL
ncbi:hypothetical protein ScPMuIL_008896 [Solemya velum]